MKSCARAARAGLLQLRLRGVFLAPAQVFGDGAREEHGLLRHQGDAPAKVAQGPRSPDVFPAHQDLAARRCRRSGARATARLLLPEPVGPMTAVIRPGSQTRFTSSSTEPPVESRVGEGDSRNPTEAAALAGAPVCAVDTAAARARSRPDAAAARSLEGEDVAHPFPGRLGPDEGGEDP